MRIRLRGFDGFAPIVAGASRERSHENGASTTMRRRRMRRSADARGKCKYVKARPEFSYSRCPPPRGIPRAPLLFPIASRLLDATTSLLSRRGPASLSLPASLYRGCMRVHLPAPSRKKNARTHVHTRTGTGTTGTGTRARDSSQRVRARVCVYT